MVANFSPVKRHDMLLQALTQVREKLPDVRCLLIGDGVLRVTVEGMAQQMGLSEMVVFFGSRSDVPDLLPAIDVFALTSDSESFSNAIVEAMALGKPVVATDCGGPAESVVEGETGFLVPPGQPVILAEKITLLLQSPILAQQMG
jgi:glycosyltransferase involved in cell wall biosynthesis